MGLFDPPWLKQVLSQKQPNRLQRWSLERLRKDRNISDDAFATLVNQSPGATKILLEREAIEFRKAQPHATQQVTFEAILQAYFTYRTMMAVLTGSNVRVQEIGTMMQNSWDQTKVRDAAAEAQSIDDLVTYLCKEDGFWERTPDPQKINERIAEILGYHRPKG